MGEWADAFNFRYYCMNEIIAAEPCTMFEWWLKTASKTFSIEDHLKSFPDVVNKEGYYVRTGDQKFHWLESKYYHEYKDLYKNSNGQEPSSYPESGLTITLKEPTNDTQTTV